MTLLSVRWAILTLFSVLPYRPGVASVHPPALATHDGNAHRRVYRGQACTAGGAENLLPGKEHPGLGPGLVHDSP